ncbi:DUF1353 domain-containing protein [Caulobacter sp. 17J80-11]|uniref:DUF1353 domain-containing protein n=1 Tax=Caulobacter sp. 17J80-11 TaxID=2763502 RepID=UPI001653512F|nr:DUF1353 domain-containing protein [Caulobacter sp. 17J80-11]MBC6981719.1 DUF1353 domain-containing protein [Caulobacter sp. 17J80-11]
MQDALQTLAAPVAPNARITDAYAVEELPGVTRDGRAVVRLVRPLEYRVGSKDSDEVIVVPVGFETDFASVPWGFRELFPQLGPWARPAIIHDWLYANRGLGRYSRADADRIFLEAMEVVGVPAWRRAPMYLAVRAGGARGWGRSG